MATTHFTTVTSSGIATANYDIATFRVSMSTVGKTPIEAQDKLRKNVAIGKGVFDALITKGMHIIEDSMKIDRSNHVQREWNKATETYEVVGYAATYTMTFKTDTMEMVSEIYEKLASVPLKDVRDYQISKPSYKVKDVNALHRTALANAWEQSKELFQQETTILGIDPATLEISAYQPHYDASEADEMARGGEIRAFAAAAGRKTLGGGGNEEETIQLTPGKAKIRVNLSVSYRVKEKK